MSTALVSTCSGDLGLVGRIEDEINTMRSGCFIRFDAAGYFEHLRYALDSRSIGRQQRDQYTTERNVTGTPLASMNVTTNIILYWLQRATRFDDQRGGTGTPPRGTRPEFRSTFLFGYNYSLCQVGS